MKILIGDDQLTEDSDWRRVIPRCYRIPGVEYEFTYSPEEFVEKAATREYKALLIDLNWTDDDFKKEYKTGYKILDAVKEYAPVRILWTSDYKEAAEKSKEHGATHCFPKSFDKEDLEKILNEVEK